MAQVQFLKGNQATLPEAKTEGNLYFVIDEGAIYLDVTSDTRIRMGDVIEVADMEALDDITNPSKTALYYITSLNALAKYDGSTWKQINPDTGAIVATATGEGNALTGVTYNGTSRTLEFTKDSTFVTDSEVDTKISALSETYAPKTHTHATSDIPELDAKLQELESKVTGVSGAMHFKGILEEDPTTLTPLDDYNAGDVVAYGEKEYVLVEDKEKKFVELGDTTAIGNRVTAIEGQLDSFLTSEDLTDYAKTADLEAAKTALIGTGDGVTSTSIKQAVIEAKTYVDTKVSAALTWGSF